MGDLFVLLAFFLCLIFSESSKLADEIASTYHKILGAPKTISVESFSRLMNLIDDDVHCGLWCKKYLESQLKKHSSSSSTSQELELDFHVFSNIIDEIYGDLISDDPYDPQEIHISLTGVNTEMTVMWLSGKELINPSVEYRTASMKECEGKVEDCEWKQSNAITSTYRVPQKWWPTFQGFIYTATLSDLPVETDIEYHVKGFDPNNTVRSSTNFIFTSAPKNRPDRVTKIATLADQGTFMLLGFAAQAKLESMKNELEIDISTVIGDLSYAGLSTEFSHLNISKEDEFERVWDLYGIQSQAVASTMPWMVTNGNHERFYNFSAFRYRYTMPWKNSKGSEDNFWYSYDYGNIHWVSISSEHDLTDGSIQKTWLETDLNNVDRTITPWVVLAIHKPMYSTVSGAPGGYADLLEDITYKYNINLFLCGHMHAYERVHPVYQGNVTCLPNHHLSNDEGVDVYTCGRSGDSGRDQGPVQVVQGNAGGMQAVRWEHPVPLWSAKRWANGYSPPSRSNNHDHGRSRSSSSSGSKLDGSNINELSIDTGVDIDAYLGSDKPKFTRDGGNRVDVDIEYSDTYGFGVVSAYNATHLHYQSYPITGDWAVDEFWIIREE